MGKVLKYIGGSLRRYLSVSFAVALVFAFVLWGGIKMGHSYTAKAGFKIIVEERSAHCTAMIEGTGYQIVKFKAAVKDVIAIERSEVKLRRITADSIVIEPNSLKGALASRYDNVRILSIDLR